MPAAARASAFEVPAAGIFVPPPAPPCAAFSSCLLSLPMAMQTMLTEGVGDVSEIPPQWIASSSSTSTMSPAAKAAMNSPRVIGLAFQFCQRPVIGPTRLAASRLRADFVRTSSCRRSAKLGYPGVWQ